MRHHDMDDSARVSFCAATAAATCTSCISLASTSDSPVSAPAPACLDPSTSAPCPVSRLPVCPALGGRNSCAERLLEGRWCSVTADPKPRPLSPPVQGLPGPKPAAPPAAAAAATAAVPPWCEPSKDTELHTDCTTLAALAAADVAAGLPRCEPSADRGMHHAAGCASLAGDSR